MCSLDLVDYWCALFGKETILDDIIVRVISINAHQPSQQKKQHTQILTNDGRFQQNSTND